MTGDTSNFCTAGRIPELDGMRGVAILLVVMRHYVHHPMLLLWGPQWGWMGVNLFFVLSGFLITGILLSGRTGGLKTFYRRRSLRVFPLYFLVLAVYFAASAAVGTAQPAKTMVLYAGFLQAFVPPLVTHLRIVPHPAWVVMGFAVLWSLSVEEWFYLLWAPVVALMRAQRRVLLGILGGVLLATPWIRYFYPDPRGGQELFIAQMDSLAAGCLVAMVWREHGIRLRPWLAARAGVVWAAVAGLIGFAIWIDFATGITKPSVEAFRVFNAAEYTVLWIAWALWLLGTLAVAGTAGWMARALRWRWLGGLGRISYCLYLVHYPVYLALREHMAHSLALIMALIVSLGISAASWRWFDGAIVRQKRSSAGGLARAAGGMG